MENRILSRSVIALTCLAGIAGCGDPVEGPASQQVLTEVVQGGTATSRPTDTGVSTELRDSKGDLLGKLTWDAQSGEARFVAINGVKQGPERAIMMKVSPSLGLANLTISNVWVKLAQAASGQESYRWGCQCAGDSSSDALLCCCFYTNYVIVCSAG